MLECGRSALVRLFLLMGRLEFSQLDLYVSLLKQRKEGGEVDATHAPAPGDQLFPE